MDKTNTEETAEFIMEMGKLAFSTRKIYLFGEINPSLAADFVSYLGEADSSPGDIEIYIYSGGGHAEAGFAMYDAIRSTKNKIITIACGMVGSAAVLPLMAGDERRIQKSAKIFLHEGELSMGGNFALKPMRSLIADTENLSTMYNSYLSERSGLPAKKIQEFCIKNTYINASQAVKLGFVNSVIPFKKAIKKKAKKGKKNVRKR